MKTSLILSAFLVATSAIAQEIPELLTEAQRAYLRGEIATAKEKFELVLKLEPNNRVAINTLRRLKAEEAKENAAKGGTNVTESMLKAVILERVKFADATLSESLEFLRQKGNQALEGKMAINFVMQLDEAAKNRRVSISLQNVPLTEVLRYVGELAGVQFSYERFAVVVKAKGATPEAAPVPASAPAPAGNGIKIDGL